MVRVDFAMLCRAVWRELGAGTSSGVRGAAARGAGTLPRDSGGVAGEEGPVGAQSTF